jgi:hypothetical protein
MASRIKTGGNRYYTYKAVRLLLVGGKLLLPPILWKGGMQMDIVSHADMYQYTLVLIGIASLIIAIMNMTKKK